MRKVAMSFMAHPDDAEMACTGTLAMLADAGWEVHIATSTGGDLGAIGTPPTESVRIRCAEGREAAEVIGATYHCLGLHDGRVVYDMPALDAAYELFREISPSLVITHPRCDYHRDHEVTHQIGRAASFAYAAPCAGHAPLAEGAGVPYLYYAHVTLAGGAIGQLPDPTTVIDVAGQMDTRKRMLACHRSQQAWLSAHHGSGDMIDHMLGRAQNAGKPYGLPAAEAFIQHRVRPYPADDILADMFGKRRDSKRS